MDLTDNRSSPFIHGTGEDNKRNDATEAYNNMASSKTIGHCVWRMAHCTRSFQSVLIALSSGITIVLEVNQTV